MTRFSEGYSQSRPPEEHWVQGCVPEHFIRRTLHALHLFGVSEDVSSRDSEERGIAHALTTLFRCSRGIFRRRGFGGRRLILLPPVAVEIVAFANSGDMLTRHVMK